MFLLQSQWMLLDMGYIGMCDPKGSHFSAVLVINRIWFWHSSLELGMVTNKVRYNPGIPSPGLRDSRKLNASLFLKS